MSNAVMVTPPDTVSRPGRPLARQALRLWHRVLSAGGSDAAQFRGWDRLITWRTHTTRGERWHEVKRFLKLPARAVREARADVRQFGRELAGHAGIPVRRQLLQLWWLRVRYGIDGHSYIQYQLYRPERWPRAGHYIQEKEFFRVGQFVKLQKARSDGRLLTDKRLFDQWCRESGLPTVPTLMEIEDGRVTPSAGADATLPDCDLFSKPADLAGGAGAQRWLYDGAGGYVGADGRSRPAAALLEELAVASRIPTKQRASGRILLQRCLRNHPSLLPLTPGGLCTVRLVTYRWPRAEARLLLAAYKMPTGTSAADNFHFGGVAAPVDLATGRLGRPVFRRGALIVEIERHPDTGTVIEGHQLPFWDEALALVLRAHDAVPRLAAIGWDVALTGEGPILVEGNTLPNPVLSQTPSGVALGDTPFLRCMNAHVRECFEA
jgi:hypothetical protein